MKRFVIIMLAACTGSLISMNFALWRIVEYLPYLVQR